MNKKAKADIRVEVRVPVLLKRALRVYCAQNDMSMQDFLIHAINVQIKKKSVV